MFDNIELEVNHRQGEDKVYAELLNRLRFKSKQEEISGDDLNLLNPRITSNQNLNGKNKNLWKKLLSQF